VADVPLSISHPALAAEADGWDPTGPLPRSNQNLGWRCSLGHQWHAILNNRQRGEGCPVCAGQKVLVGFNDLATTDPELATEAHDWDPTTVTRGSAFVGAWECMRGHQWEAAVYSRVAGSGCPICSGRQVLAGYNDLATTHPDVAAEADGWDPATVRGKSHQKKAWCCPAGHRYEASIAHRTGGRDCPYCSGNRVLVGFNDLATTDPMLAREAVGWDSTMYSRGSGVYLGWRCPLGHDYRARIPDRRAGNGCPYCSGQKVLVGFNDLATISPSLAAQADGWDPTTVTKANNPKRQWKCIEGHTWFASVNQRMRVGTGCPYCANKAVWPGFNDLATTNPELVREIVAGDPTAVTRRSGKKFRWRCDLGHEWTASVDHRVDGRGCPACAKTGFDPSRPGWLYLLAQPDWGLLQIGITNVPTERLVKHRSRGWVDVDLRGPMDGNLARSWEVAILKMLAANGAVVGSTDVAGTFDGYTEAWMASSYPTPSLADLIEEVHHLEDLEPPQSPAVPARWESRRIAPEPPTRTP
jgi:hypothetical protein